MNKYNIHDVGAYRNNQATPNRDVWRTQSLLAPPSPLLQLGGALGCVFPNIYEVNKQQKITIFYMHFVDFLRGT